MLLLDINKLSKNFGYGTLFNNLSFSLNDGESISIVGPNGCGKSTLLKIIAGFERYDGGTLSLRKGTTIAYLDQVSSSINDERPVKLLLKEAFDHLNKIEEKINNLQEKLNNCTDEQEHTIILEKYCNLIEEYSLKGGYDIDVNINIVCEGLKINSNLLKQSYNSLSGGEKTLVQLAKALLLKPDLFLLDEPTNHLDIERIEWLENYLKSFKGASIIVSHDRYFLDKVSTKILSLNDQSPKIYFTNYSGFLLEYQKDFEKKLMNYKDQQIIIKRLEEQIKYFSERGMATNSSTLCDRAHALQTQLDRIKKNAITRPKETRKLDVNFIKEKKSSKTIIEATDLTIKINDEQIILDNISMNICSNERVAFIGSNGSGKSSFIKTMMNEQDLNVIGKIIVGPSVIIGYLPQIINFDKDNLSVLDYFKDKVSVFEQEARAILSSFHFSKEDVNKKIKNLSGGEKIRIKLAELLQQKINTLIFDEPTNHIDIPTKEVLEEALEKFNGTLIFVSHDRYFINKFAQKTYEFNNHKIKLYNGNYDYYKEKNKKH